MSAGRIKISQMPDSGVISSEDLFHLVQGGNNTKLTADRFYDYLSQNSFPRVHVIEEGYPPNDLGNVGDMCFSMDAYPNPNVPGNEPWLFGPKTDQPDRPWGEGIPLQQGPQGEGIVPEGNPVFWIGDNTLRQSYAIPSGKNAMSAGPLAINEGAVVDVPDGSQWTVVGEEDIAPAYLRDLLDVNVDASANNEALIYNQSEDMWYAAPAPKGDKGDPGEDGADSTVPGPQGEKGDPFEYDDFTPEQLDDLQGPQGDPGPGFDYKGNVDTEANLPGYPNSYSGEDGDAYFVEDVEELFAWGADDTWSSLGNVKGPPGEDSTVPGPPGDAAKVQVGTTTTGAPGSDAEVVNSGSDSWAVLDFTIPEGLKGETGDPATVDTGITTTLPPGTQAEVINTGTNINAVFEFHIPSGERGLPGKDGLVYSLSANDTGAILLNDTDGGNTSVQFSGEDGVTIASTASTVTVGLDDTIAKKEYVDAGDASTLSDANAYADAGDASTLQDAKNYADAGDATTLSDAKDYTDTQIAAIPDPDLSELYPDTLTINKWVKEGVHTDSWASGGKAVDTTRAPITELTWTGTGAGVISLTPPLGTGYSHTVIVNKSGSIPYSFDSSIKWNEGDAPDIEMVGSHDVFTFVSAGSSWLGFWSGRNMA